MKAKQTAQALGPDATTLHVSGAAGVVGGLSITASGIWQSLQSPGCIADECVGQAYRSPGPVEAILMVAGASLVAIATLGLVTSQPAARRVVRTAGLVAAAGVLGALMMLASGLYYIGLALVLVAIAAYVVMGISLASSRMASTWQGILLAVSALLLLGADGQNERILFVVPFGLVWIVLGALLWTLAESGKEGVRGGTQLA